MYQLTCPSCRSTHTVQYTRIGATATCVSCGEKFKVDTGSVKEIAPVKALQPLGDVLPLVDEPDASTETIREAPTPPVQSIPKRSPLLIPAMILIVVALGLLTPFWIRGKPHEETRATPGPPTPTKTAPDEDRFEPKRVELISMVGVHTEAPADSVALESVSSRIGTGTDENGEMIYWLAILNPTDRVAVNPRFILEIIGDEGEVLKSWFGQVESAIAPRRWIEFEAHPGPGEAPPPAGRILLRAYVSQDPAQP